MFVLWLSCSLAVCLFCVGRNALLLVIWLGLNVIGLVVVVGWERGVVGNVVLDGCFFCMDRMFLFVCRVCWDQWFWCECVLSCLEPLFVVLFTYDLCW